MAIQLARRMDGLRASEIRELLKLTERPEVIAFSGGLPAPEVFPIQEMAECARATLESCGAQALQYSATEGHGPLRETIAARMNGKLGTHVGSDEILVTCGSQQGLDLTGKLFLDEGDTVLCESPTYLGALQALRAYRPRFVEVPTDDEGMLIDELETRLANDPRVKLVYVVPTFQNPSGRTWSLRRRQAFMQVVQRHGAPVIEDDPYGELRFEGDPLPPLKALDKDGLVVYLGTFSKILCPGLRIGWLAASPSLYDRYVLAKQGTDLHTSGFSQALIATYLERFDIDAAISRIRALYGSRRDLMVDTLEEELPPGVTFTRPHGGLFLWLELPDNLSAREIFERCLERNVAFVPGGSFFPNGGHENTLRLNYSNMSEERIVEGVRRLAAVIREALEADPARELPQELAAHA